MIARLWRGETPAAKSEEYYEFVQKTGIPDYKATPGNKAVYVLRRVNGDRAEFLLLTLWESWEAIQAFAGEDVEKAVYYPEDPDYLLEMDEHVRHFEVLERLE